MSDDLTDAERMAAERFRRQMVVAGLVEATDVHDRITCHMWRDLEKMDFPAKITNVQVALEGTVKAFVDLQVWLEPVAEFVQVDYAVTHEHSDPPDGEPE